MAVAIWSGGSHLGPKLHAFNVLVDVYRFSLIDVSSFVICP